LGERESLRVSQDRSSLPKYLYRHALFSSEENLPEKKDMAHELMQGRTKEFAKDESRDDIT
jgi:hypothetical protein